MQRIPEPELMDDPAQARAYALADFSEPHDRFVALFGERLPGHRPRRVLDLGCGPADITLRVARAYPDCRILGVDGAPAMLAHGAAAVVGAGLAARVELMAGYLPEARLPTGVFDTVISNSLLHHLVKPLTLWQAVQAAVAPGAAVFIMDLMRPPTPADAQALVEEYAADEPSVLRQDFFNSLCAAYTVPEVRAQLEATGLGGLNVEAVSDRHWIVYGSLS